MRSNATRGGRGCGASARLLPAIAAGERVAGDALVPPDEHVPVDAAPTEAEARCRGKRVRVLRVNGVAVGRGRIAWSHTRSSEEGGRPEGQASLGEGGLAECDEHEGPEADHEGLHRPASNTKARRQLGASKPIPAARADARTSRRAGTRQLGGSYHARRGARLDADGGRVREPVA